MFELQKNAVFVVNVSMGTTGARRYFILAVAHANATFKVSGLSVAGRIKLWRFNFAFRPHTMAAATSRIDRLHHLQVRRPASSNHSMCPMICKIALYSFAECD